jgi:hypothetical protein
MIGLTLSSVLSAILKEQERPYKVGVYGVLMVR